jgi:hypothetical protein
VSSAAAAAAVVAKPEPKGRSALKAAERAAMGAEAFDKAERAKKQQGKRGGKVEKEKGGPAGGRTGGGGGKKGGGGADGADEKPARKRSDRAAASAAVVVSRNEKKTLAALAAPAPKGKGGRLIEALAPSAMDAASAAHVRALGLAARNRVMAALYMARCDLSAVVRQVALKVRCGRGVMPTRPVECGSPVCA